MKVLATYSIKGGVGKTTAAVNLAFEASRSGARVLLWDLDPQGAATFVFRVEPAIKGGTKRLIGDHGVLDEHIRATDYTGLHVVPADFSLRHLDLRLEHAKRSTRRLHSLLDDLGDGYDVAILDCPPGITLSSEAVFAAVDGLLVPTVPSTLSIRTLDQLLEFLGRAPQPLVLPFASMVDRRKRLHRDLIADLVTEVPALLPTVIPSSSVIEQMGVHRAPVGAFAPRSVAAASFRQLWLDISARLALWE